jgi:hypothetical protein
MDWNRYNTAEQGFLDDRVERTGVDGLAQYLVVLGPSCPSGAKLLRNVASKTSASWGINVEMLPGWVVPAAHWQTTSSSRSSGG